jgi:4-hydroxyphenylpyruvate dioxygenase
MGTDGFEFIEYAAPDPKAMGELFERMGFTAVARHRRKNVTLYRQGEINFIINAEPDSLPSASRACTAQHLRHRLPRGRRQGPTSAPSPGRLGRRPRRAGRAEHPGHQGHRDSIIYFIDRWRGKAALRPARSATSASTTSTSSRCPACTAPPPSTPRAMA